MPDYGIEIYSDDKEYDFSGFDCGEGSLNVFLQDHLIRQHRSRILRAYMLINRDMRPRIMGFYTLSGSSFEKAALPSNSQKRHIPYVNVQSVTLGRLAVDKTLQGQAWGSTLVAHAMTVVYQASQAVGIHGLFVGALNENAQQFYRKLGFIPLVRENARSLFYPTKSMEKLFRP